MGSWSAWLPHLSAVAAGRGGDGGGAPSAGGGQTFQRRPQGPPQLPNMWKQGVELHGECGRADLKQR